MRVLHTADWHFGKTLEGRDRLPEQRRFVDELCQICDDEQIDLILMAGDVYQTFNPSAEAEELFYEALDRLSAHGTRGIVVISGNHDSPDRLSAPFPLADRLGITLLGLPKEPLHATIHPAVGRVQRVAAGPSWLELNLPSTNEHCVIAALPYPSESRLNELLSESLDEADIQAGYSQSVQTMFQNLASHFRKDTVNLAMSHLYVRGGLPSDSEQDIAFGGAYLVDPAVFPETAQYVALGHLHRPQWVQGTKVPVRYAGSPIAYSFSETGYTKSVTVIDVLPGESAKVHEVPLSCGRPLVKWVARGGVEEALRWIESGKDEAAFIDLEVHVSSTDLLLDSRDLRRLRPDLVSVHFVFTEAPSAFVPEGVRHLPVDEQFRRFYEKERGRAPDKRMVEVFLRLLEEYGVSEKSTEEE